MEKYFVRVAVIAGVVAGFAMVLLIVMSNRADASSEQSCDEFLEHEHGLLCNSGFRTVDRGMEIRAGRALLWYASGSMRIHRMWLTDGVLIKFKADSDNIAQGSSNQAEYRLDKREIALLGGVSFSVGENTVTGERIEYSLNLGRLLRRTQ